MKDKIYENLVKYTASWVRERESNPSKLLNLILNDIPIINNYDMNQQVGNIRITLEIRELILRNDIGDILIAPMIAKKDGIKELIAMSVITTTKRVRPQNKRGL